MKQGQSFLFDELFLEIEEGRGDKSSCGQILILKEQPPPPKKTNPNSRGRWPPTIESDSVPKCLPLKRFFFFLPGGKRVWLRPANFRKCHELTCVVNWCHTNKD